MDRILDEAGFYDKPKSTETKCKNFDICQNYLTKEEKEACDKACEDYICTDCIRRKESEEMDDKRLSWEIGEH